MDIHKPKPWHGFREFLKEYLIIVVGVLTALGAEQVVQQIDWRTRVSDAEGDMQAELHENARAAFARLTTVNCATAQIEARRKALVSNRETGAPIASFGRYQRSAQLWSTDAWESAHSLQLTGHLPTDRMQRYSRAYAMAAIFRDQQRREQELKPGVDTLSTAGSSPSPMEGDRLLLALQELEAQSNRLDNAAFRFLELGGRVGIHLSDEERADRLARSKESETDDVRGCVQDPSPWLSHGDRAANWLVSRSGSP